MTKLDELKVVEAFDRKLALYGYAPLPEYDKPRLMVTDFMTYRIVEQFPRLARSHLPVGVGGVSYEIKAGSNRIIRM